MKKIIISLTMVLFFTSLALAQTKLAIIDMKNVISSSEPGQKAMKQLKKKFEKMKQKLDQQRQELQNLREELQKQSLVLSQEAKQDKELEFKRKVRDFQDMFQTYRRKMRMEEKKLSDPIIETLIQIIKDYGKKHKYTAILDAKSSGLLYADDAIDITREIIVELNRAWRAKEKNKSGKK